MIIQVYREHPDLVDAEVLNAVESLTRKYGAEAEGKSISSRPLPGITKQVAESLKEMAEFRLGRSPLPEGLMRTQDSKQDSKSAAPGLERPEPISLEVLTACQKRIQSSIKFWTKERGRQGYLHYIQNFLQ